MDRPELIIPYLDPPPDLSGDRMPGAAWARVRHWYPEDLAYRPETGASVVYSSLGIHLHFTTLCKYGRPKYSKYQDPVYKDSCVEFFVHPDGAPGYFNFEFNARGALLASYIEDPTRTDTGFVMFTKLADSDGSLVGVRQLSGNGRGAALGGSAAWSLAALIPWELFRAYCDAALPPAPGTIWRGNFYKCGDDTPEPHWGAWSDVGERLDFHQPDRFGRLIFGR
jgi:hypothetical protein